MEPEREQASEPTPKRIGHYLLRELIGTGGMGKVYRAHDPVHDRDVAIKLLAPSLAADPNSVRRFEREIEVLKRLDHPNIVRLLDSGRHGGVPYFVMEYVDGQSLTKLMRRLGRVPWRQAVHWAIQICEALAHAHARQVIHRDLKPGNVLIAPDGCVKLTDFGVARLFGTATLTTAGNVVGTVEYMSPEQAAGKRADARSDLYSLGVLLYTMVTGRTPFRGKDYLEVLQKHRFGTYDPARKLVPEIPIWLDDLIGELLEKDPQRRPPNAETVRRRLNAVLRKVDLHRSAEPRPERSDTFVLEQDVDDGVVVEPETDETAVLIQQAGGPRAKATVAGSPTLTMRLMRALAGSDERPIERRRRLFGRLLLVMAVVMVVYGGYRYWMHAADPGYQWQRLRQRISEHREGDLAVLIPELRSFVERFAGTPEAEQAEEALVQLELRRRRRQLLRSPLVRALRPSGTPASRAEEQYLAALLVRWLQGRDAALAALEELLGSGSGGAEAEPVLEMAAQDYIALSVEKIQLLRREGREEEANELLRRLLARFQQHPSPRVRRFLAQLLTRTGLHGELRR